MVGPIDGGSATANAWRALEEAVHPAQPPQHASTVIRAESRAELLRPPFDELPAKLNVTDLASRELMQADVRGDIRYLATCLAACAGALPADTPAYGDQASAQVHAGRARLAQLRVLDAILTNHQAGQDPFASGRSGHEHSMPELLALLDFQTRVLLVCDWNVTHMGEYRPAQAGDAAAASMLVPRSEAARNVDTGLRWLKVATSHRLMGASRTRFMHEYRPRDDGDDWQPMRFRYGGQVKPTDLPSHDRVRGVEWMTDAIAVHRLAIELQEVEPPASADRSALGTTASLTEAWMGHLEARVASSVMRYALLDQMGRIGELSRRLNAVVVEATKDNGPRGEYGSGTHVSAEDARKLQAAGDRFLAAVRKAYDQYEDGVRYAFRGDGYSSPPPHGVDWTPAIVNSADSLLDEGNTFMAAVAEPLADLNALLTEISGRIEDGSRAIRLTDDQRELVRAASQIQEHLYFDVSAVPPMNELDAKFRYGGLLQLAKATVRCDALDLGNVDEQTRREAQIRHLTSDGAVNDYWILHGPVRMPVPLPRPIA